MSIVNPVVLNPVGQSEIFWGEIAPCEHLVQVYEDDGAFLDALEGFIGGGLRAGDGAIVVATPEHIEALDRRLTAAGIDLRSARAGDRYIALDAEEMLSRFMVGGWPDEELFEEAVTEVLTRAGRGGRRVRAFGEMVALLWGRGNNDATLRLENLWHRLCQTKLFSLFCAYPRRGFAADASSSIREICDAHSRVVAGQAPLGWVWTNARGRHAGDGQRHLVVDGPVTRRIERA